jgi:hypothetical protein
VAQHRHKRKADVRRPTPAVLVSAPIAVIVTLSAVTAGVLSAAPTTTTDELLATPAKPGISDPSPRSARSTTASRHTSLTNRRDVVVSRSQVRSSAPSPAQATRRAVRGADTKLWTTEDLDLWDAPGEGAEQVGLLPAGRQVVVTGRRQAGRAEVVLAGKARWVTSDYLSRDKPEPGPSLGGQCANGTSIDAGRASLYDIYNAVCSNWPQVTSYGTWRSDGEHGQGRAMDIMVSGETGWEVANFLRANYAALGIEYLIHARNIWSVERAGEGWRGMADRGSVTANHLDHVHVTVY